MTKIAVTGCAGFVGSWICEKALAAGYEIIGIDNLTSGINFTPKGVEFHNSDLNGNIKSILQNVDAVIHAAAYAELRHNWEDKSERDKLFLNNEMATRSVLEQMPNVPIIFLSTAAVYGSMSHNKISKQALIESDAGPDSVESPYAASKLACEAYVTAWAHKKNIPWYSLRLVNQIGARTHRGVIPDFLKMVREKQHIHAADNGNQTKNWVNVEDTANAVIHILGSEVPSGIYTVTSLERWSWRDIVKIMLKMHQEKYPNTPDPFSLTYEDRLGGSIGDPLNLYVSGDKLKPYYSCDASVEKAVREALTFLGWSV
jgi:UDP-glucose 4-epimerase